MNHNKIFLVSFLSQVSLYNYQFCFGSIFEPPVIDIAPLRFPENYSVERVAEATLQIHQACQQWGFFNVINHGIAIYDFCII